MPRKPSFALVLVTAPNLRTARKLARLALQERLIACANLIPKLESHYWWQDKVTASTEVLLILKTRRPLLSKLERLIVAAHPYDTPEFVVLALSGGNARYLAWLSDSTQRPARR
jgi:periplasmic divalent cation tolerance protein